MLFTWRRAMNASYAQARATPLDVIKADLEYIGIEEQVKKKKSEQHNAHSKQ